MNPGGGSTAPRAISDWLASLPRDREFSLDWAYNQLLDDHPKRAITKNNASSAITRSGRFETWMDGRCRMFKFRGPK